MKQPNIEEILKTDWTVWLERRSQPAFFAVIFCHAEGGMLEKETGKALRHHVCVMDDGATYYLRSERELEETDAYHHALIQDPKNKKKIEEWARLGREYYVKADTLIKEFSGDISDVDIISRYPAIIAECYDIFLYTTSLPYFLMSGINHAIEKGASREDFEGALKMIDPLRAQTRYTEIIGVVFQRIWEVAARKSGTHDAAFFSRMSPDELGKYFSGRLDIEGAGFRERESYSVFWLDPITDKVEWLQDKNRAFARIAHSEHEQAMQDAKGNVGEPKGGASSVGVRMLTELKGSVAYQGIVHGRARIVNSIDGMKGFQEGDVLVSIQSSPSLMPAIQKCSAIVTDEGGIMCHAAIVARELKKPCIIGTKVATKVIKDGDMLEVDADKGIVRILS